MQRFKCHCAIMRNILIPCLSCTNTQQKNYFSTKRMRDQNHYQVLGITSESTQADIKSAYYELSKVYHPDKNEGCATAAQKFRDITSAYEVLGNFKLRRLYDKGLIHTAESIDIQDVSRTSTHDEVADDDDPQTKFYKRHMRRTEAPNMTGRTPIYDFDAWNNAHYGKVFNRRLNAKQKYNSRQEQEMVHKNISKNELIIFGALFSTLVGLFVIFQFNESRNDVPSRRRP